MNMRTEAKTGVPEIAIGGKARESAYLKDVAVRGSNRRKGSSVRNRSLTQTSPSESTPTNPINPALTELLPRNTACTFIDSVMSLLRRSAASFAEMSEPVPEDMFLLLVRTCGFREAIYWAKALGLAHSHSCALLSLLLSGGIDMNTATPFRTARPQPESGGQQHRASRSGA